MKFLLTIIQLALLAACYGVLFNQWIKPSSIPVFNILPLGFLILFVLNGLMLVFWWLYSWKTALLFTLLSLGLILPLQNYFQLNNQPESDSNLKVLTYNVRYFYDDSDGIISILKQENADIVLIQEMGPQPEWIIQQGFDNQKHYFEDFNSLGIASKYPIITAQRFRTKPYPTSFCYADIALPTDTVRVINFYLESLHIDQREVKNTEFNSKAKNTGLSLARKMVRASKIHQNQIAEIRDFIHNSPHPVILAGDMNAVPGSYEYYTLKRGFNDTFRSKGKGFGSTFPGFKFPLRLDYIMTSPEFEIKNHRIHTVNYSDHYPVVAELKLP